MPEAPAKAPDPATITFGTNKPIVAAPPPKPAGSGLRFSGPSDGELQSSGPQQTSLKAEGLTFSSAGSSAGSSAAPSAAQSEAQGAAAKPKSEAGDTATAKIAKCPPAKGKPKPPADKTGSSAKAAPNDRKTDEKGGAKADQSDGKAARKTPAVTKPAIAPQQHGPRIEKTSPRRTGAFALFSLGMAAVGLLLWFGSQSAQDPRSGGEPAVPSAALESRGEGDGTVADATAKPEPEAPAAAAEGGERTEIAKAAEPAAATAPAGLTTAELTEVQGLLRRLSLDPGEASGELTEATRQAIRSYQEMAGLPVDGEANQALLQELRAVVSLYQGG